MGQYLQHLNKTTSNKIAVDAWMRERRTQEFMHLLRKCCSDREFQVLELRYGDRKTWRQIATTMELPVSSCYRLCQKTLCKIRRHCHEQQGLV